MKINNLLILTLLLIAAGCSPQKRHPLQSNQAASGHWTLPYGEWNFSFITPYELPSEVLHVRVIDTDGYLYIFNTLDQASLTLIPSRNGQSAHGFGDQFNKVKKPPQYIVFCWDSYIDQQTYETSAVFGPETWLRMKVPADHAWSNGDLVWYDNMTFGLSPVAKSISGSPMSPGAPASASSP
jgi:hypothetical protein